MLRLDWAWAVGIVDGEGWIGFQNIEKNNRETCIKVTMTHKETVEKLASIFGGPVGGPRMATLSTKEIWDWWIYRGDHIREVLEKIVPYMVTKRACALAMLEYLSYRSALLLQGRTEKQREILLGLARDVRRVA